MWLFGVDERTGIVPSQPQDPATWRDQLAREFDGFAPAFDHYNLEWAGETFTAVVFETDAAPFVILNPNRGQPSSGPFEREVPWREGRTRSATRSEVIMIARPPARLPIVEVVAGRVTITDTSTSPLHNWDVDITFYGVSETLSRMFFPFFGVHAHIETAAGERIEFRNFGLGPVGEDPHVVFSRDNQLMIDGAARFRFYGTARTEAAPNPINQSITVMIKLKVAGNPLPVIVPCAFRSTTERFQFMAAWATVT